MNQFIDTHCHLYDQQFDEDRAGVVQKAIEAGVGKMYLPNCNSTTIEPMMQLVADWPQHCFAMMGLHPCYVKENVAEELAIAEKYLNLHSFSAIGEIGLDYYWDTTFVAQQKNAFNLQMDWALEKQLPIVIHSRESLTDCIDMVRQKQNGRLSGVFHCFGGTVQEAQQIIDLGFYLGIGGVATFKKSTLPDVLKVVGIGNVVLETDAPYLAPVPYRGKRNESSYIPLIADLVAKTLEMTLEEVANATTINAANLFKPQQNF